MTTPLPQERWPGSQAAEARRKMQRRKDLVARQRRRKVQSGLGQRTPDSEPEPEFGWRGKRELAENRQRSHQWWRKRPQSHQNRRRTGQRMFVA